AAADRPLEPAMNRRRDLLVRVVLAPERVVEQILRVDQLTIALPMVDRGRRLELARARLDELLGSHGDASYRAADADPACATTRAAPSPERVRGEDLWPRRINTIAAMAGTPHLTPVPRDRATHEEVRLTGDRLV